MDNNIITMIIQGNSNNFFQLNIREAEEKRYNLVHILKGLQTLSYQKGSRKDDYTIRDYVNKIVSEVKDYNIQIKHFDFVKSGDLKVCEDILLYFDDHFLNNNNIVSSLESLDAMIEASQKTEKLPDKSGKDVNTHRRVINLFINELMIDLRLWEKTYNNSLVVYMVEFLGILNDICCFLSINNVLQSNKDIKNDIICRFFYNCLKYELKIHKKILNESELASACHYKIRHISHKNKFFDNQLLTDEFVRIITSQLIKEMPSLLSQSQVSCYTSVNNLVTEIDKKHIRFHDVIDKNYNAIKDVKEFLNNLNQIESLSAAPHIKIEKNILSNKIEKYLFHTVGDYNDSVSYITANFCEILIFVYKWIIKEWNNDSNIISFMRPLLDHTSDCNEFINLLITAHKTAKDPSNQAVSMVLSREKHYISKALARKLFASIVSLSNIIHEGLTAVYSATSEDKVYKNSIILKRINIIHDDYYSAYNKIRGRISQHLGNI